MNSESLECVKSGSWGSTMVIMAVLGILAVFGIPYLERKQMADEQDACINNLLRIDSGKECAAMAYRLTDGDVIASVSLNERFKGNAAPTCPSGGTYTYNAIGTRPQCSLEAPKLHELL